MKNLPVAAHCSLTLSSLFWFKGRSSKVVQPLLMAVFARRLSLQKLSPLLHNFTPPPPHQNIPSLSHQFTPIDRLLPLLQQNSSKWNYSRHIDEFDTSPTIFTEEVIVIRSWFCLLKILLAFLSKILLKILLAI